ncbi:uncharacterized protein [Emydura macquarii macquarii]|uniref:uncharacterized protein n=1 Tax=Emydura macquarii macquarii TaxID=1129001 RepID=UPI00352ADCBF
MKSVLLFLSLLSAPTCVLSQVQLVQSGPGVVKPGQTLTLTCAVSGVSITSSSNAWIWIRQPPGKGLEWVAYIYPYNGSKLFAASLQSRTTISSDNSKNQYSLQLASLTAADTATYYCGGDAQQHRAKQGLVQKGETLTLTCTVTGDSVTTSYYWTWIRWAPGKGVEWMGYVYQYGGSTEYTPAFRGRITISADTAKNQFSLQLRSLTAADTATYYCASSTVTQSEAGTAQKGEADSKPSYVLSQVQLVQTGPAVVKPGGSLSITCKVSGTSFDSYYWSWNRQPPG